ncbi:AHH domain-containing protein [Pseudobacteroides cellulosolvens]|uniref:Uncharacterized protein n=1 Tax=Pseudobacteroides cellulosolvens ATCC 35603 = DSM 2933 TaxID=398512 RepID=A0A0L6JLB0_9FIRM|nr:AHH domain-containing protein [Pseudobacteroides cellulosolvens]KNY26559.1 hypothetical protein Bccel_1824 [Pseudobacteroides cellulosolvens ATCC 35603 = DSM 2933]
MGNDVAKTGASSAVLADLIISKPKSRDEVKAEIEKRLEAWKAGLTSLAEGAQRLMNTYLDKMDALEDRLGIGDDVSQEIAELEARIADLQVKKYTSEDLEKQRQAALQSVMKDWESNVCPFCGRVFSDAGGVGAHLNISDKQVEEMNTAATRSSSYARTFKNNRDKEGGESISGTVDAGLKKEVAYSEEIHHLISVDPYATTLRLSRVGNLAGFNVNGISNLIALATVAQSFKADHGKSFTKLPQEVKERIYELITDKTGNQIHQGAHDGPYEERLIQRLSELEQKIMKLSEGGCIGQTKDGQTQAKDMFDSEVAKLQEEIKNDLAEFDPKEIDPETAWILSQINMNIIAKKKGEAI